MPMGTTTMPLPLARVYDRSAALGQMYSHRPQPLHLPASTLGRRSPSRVIASRGHSSWHLVQPFHVHATHRSLTTSATPNLTDSALIGCSAPVGQTGMHSRHRSQYPRRKFNLGVPAAATLSLTRTGDTAP